MKNDTFLVIALSMYNKYELKYIHNTFYVYNMLFYSTSLSFIFAIWI